jgi:hypothetical protein
MKDENCPREQAHRQLVTAYPLLSDHNVNR